MKPKNADEILETGCGCIALLLFGGPFVVIGAGVLLKLARTVFTWALS